MNTGTSQHICRDKRLFIAPLVKCSGVEIGGLGGSISAAGVGTIQLSIVDDQHRPHNIILHNVLYVPESPVNLISPQRWTQESVMKEGANKGTFFCNFGDESIFVSNKRQYMKTIFNDPVTNLPILQCKGAGDDDVQYFAEKSEICFDCHCFNTTSTVLPVVPHIIPPGDGKEVHPNQLAALAPVKSHNAGPVLIEDDEDSVYDNIPTKQFPSAEYLEETLTLHGDDVSDCATVYNDDQDALDIGGVTSLMDNEPLIPTDIRVHNQTPFDVSVDVASNENAENLAKSKDVQKLLEIIKDPLSKLEKEWMAVHYQLKHLPHSKMMRLVKAGHLDPKFSKVPKLRCPHCIIATQGHKPSRYKPSKAQGLSHIRKPNHDVPGACASYQSTSFPCPRYYPSDKR